MAESVSLTYGQNQAKNNQARYSDTQDNAVQNALGYAEYMIADFDTNNDNALDATELAKSPFGKNLAANVAQYNTVQTTVDQRQGKPVLDATDLAALMLLKDLKNTNAGASNRAYILTQGLSGDMGTTEGLENSQTADLEQVYKRFNLGEAYKSFLQKGMSILPKFQPPTVEDVERAKAAQQAQQQAEQQAQQGVQYGYPTYSVDPPVPPVTSVAQPLPPLPGYVRITNADGATIDLSQEEFESTYGGRRAVTQHEQQYHSPAAPSTTYPQYEREYLPNTGDYQGQAPYYTEDPYYSQVPYEAQQQPYYSDRVYEAERPVVRQVPAKMGTSIQEVMPWIVTGLGVVKAINQMDRENQMFDRGYYSPGYYSPGFAYDPWGSWGGGSTYDLGFNQGSYDPVTGDYSNVYGNIGSGWGNWGPSSILGGFGNYSNLGFNQGSIDGFGNYRNIYGNIYS